MGKKATDVWLPFAFVASAILFLLTGLYAIKNIGETMRKNLKI